MSLVGPFLEEANPFLHALNSLKGSYAILSEVAEFHPFWKLADIPHSHAERFPKAEILIT